MRTGIPPVVLVLCLLSSACEQDPAPPRARASHEVYTAVIRHAVLEDGWAGHPDSHEERAPIERLVVLGETDPEGRRRVSYSLVDELGGLDSATVADFNSRTERVQFVDSLRGVGEYEFVSYDSVGRVLQNGWRAFHRAFPGSPGLVAFSNVGFGSEGNQALVSMMHIRGGTWGHTTLYLLEREDGEWRVVAGRRLADY